MKIAMIINKELPLGLIANTAAVLGISLGKMFPEEIVGSDVKDGDGQVHPGITARTIPVLAADRERIKQLRDSLFAKEDTDVTVIDFSEVAQRCVEYDSYRQMLSCLTGENLYYLGICLYGSDKKVNKLTGNLALLR